MLLHWQTTERDIDRIALQLYRGFERKRRQEHSFERRQGRAEQQHHPHLRSSRARVERHVAQASGSTANKEVPTTKKMIKDEKCDTAYHHIYELGGHQAFKAL